MYVLLRYRETFVIKYGNPLDDEDLVSFDPDARGTFLLTTRMDDTCPPSTSPHKTEMDAGLCYEPCVRGYNGVGPVCWAETVNVGVGKPVGLRPCPGGWVNDGLTCRQPITCGKGWKFFTEGCSGGRVQGRLPGVCGGGNAEGEKDLGNLPNWLVDKSNPKKYIATHPSYVDGLCYKGCPPDKPDRVPGMPYLCFRNTRGLSYGRGVGDMPPLFRIGNK